MAVITDDFAYRETSHAFFFWKLDLIALHPAYFLLGSLEKLKLPLQYLLW